MIGDIELVAGKVIVRPPMPEATGAVEIQGAEAALRLQKSDNTALSESYVVAFGPDANGNNRKQGVIAFQMPDPNADDGCGAVNVHATVIVDGMSHDSYGWVYFGGRGLRVFPPSPLIAEAPGDGIMAVDGTVVARDGLATAADLTLSATGHGIIGTSVGGTPLNLLRVDTMLNGRIIAGHSVDYPLCLVSALAADINASSASLAGGLLWDATNGWLVGYGPDGTRYKFIGTPY